MGETSVGLLQVGNGDPMNGKKEKQSYAEVVTPNSLACGESVFIEVGATGTDGVLFGGLVGGGFVPHPRVGGC